MTIKLHPQTQDEYNDWVKLGKRALTRRVFRQSIDDSAVVATLLEVRRSLQENATDEDFTARALHSFVWYWGRIKEDTRGVEARRILKEVPFIRDYLKESQSHTVDIDALHGYIRSRGYRVGRDAIIVALYNTAQDSESSVVKLESKNDTLKTIPDSVICSCLLLYKSLYGETVGLQYISKVFYLDPPDVKVARLILVSSINHLLAFIRHQLSQDMFDVIASVIVNFNHKPTLTYKEVFHV